MTHCIYKVIKSFFFLVVIVFSTTENYAQNQKVRVTIPAYSNVTKRELPFDVEVFDMKDTTKINVSVGYLSGIGRFIDVLAGKKYLIYATAQKKEEITPGRIRYYEDERFGPEEIEVNLYDYKGTTFETEPIFFKLRLKKDLNEVTVQASRIMFYHNGDTLVYNASAFVLAEGTMLDGLIKQLPGVSIDRNGVIKCNGRRVEQLLLNGKDLFNGKNELMLENIGAYAVKNIAVYDKAGDMSEMLGRKVAGDSKYVMDVRLKRQYMSGLMGNVDAGYGTEDRYLGRAFAMWYSDNASVATYANINNLSTETKPGSQEGSWSAQDMGTGVSTRSKGGVTYSVDGAMDKWSIKGDMEGGYDKTDDQTTINSQNYLPGGDTYSASWSRRVSRSYAINTKHNVTLKPTRTVKLWVNPNLRHSNRRTEDNLLSASFSEDPGELSRGDVAGIFSSDGSLIRKLINRYSSLQLGRGKNTSFQADPGIFLTLRTPGNNRQGLEIGIDGEYDYHSDYTRERYALEYSSEATTGGEVMQLNQRDPDNKWSIRPHIKWRPYICSPQTFSKIETIIEYSWNHSEDNQTSNVYRLEGLTTNHTDNKIYLPSINDFLNNSDPNLSFSNKEYANRHKLKLYSLFQTKYNEDKFYILAVINEFSIEFSDRHFTYMHRNVPQHLKRSDLLFKTSGYLYPRFGKWDILPFSKQFYYKIAAVEVPFMQIVDLPQSNPLYVFKGNPNLKNGYSYYISLKLDQSDKKRDRSKRNIISTITFSYSTVTDALASGYIYDRNTGVRTYKTYNVNGNWTGDASYRLFTYLDKRHRLDLSATTAAGIVSSVDMIGSESGGEVILPRRNRVNTYHVSENLRLNFTSGRHRLTLHAEGRLNRYEGHGDGFSNFTSRTLKAGATAVLNLPGNWGLSTDFTVYGRGGFADNRLNTVEPVWNMRLTKSLMKGNIVLIADGYDLLRRLTNVNYMVNAQGRTETVTNVIPAYILMHLQVRFNKKPPQR